MTEKERSICERNFKIMKLKHPFKFKLYETYTLSVLEILDILGDLDKLLTSEDDTQLELEIDERVPVEITTSIAALMGYVRVWQESPLFHPFQSEAITTQLQRTVESLYKYIQDILNNHIFDMNSALLEYIEDLRHNVMSAIEEVDDEDDEEIDEPIRIADADDTRLQNAIRMRNQLVADRLVAKMQVNMVKGVLGYDYIEIITGVDIIRERKMTSKRTGAELIKRSIKFVDLNELKGAKRDEFIKHRS